MTDQITVPRATLDALSADLQAVRPADSLSDSRLRLVVRELAVLTAASAVGSTVNSTSEPMPDCWVVIEDGQIVGIHDAPFSLGGIQAVRYTPAKGAP